MRVGDNVFNDPVASRRIGIGQAIKQRALFRVVDFMLEIAPFFVKKSFTVSDEKLQIASIGAIHIRIINLVDDAVAEGEPNAATGVVRRADALLGAAGPAWFDARRAKGH